MSFIQQGGMWFTLPILIMGLTSLGLFIYMLPRKLNQKEFGKKQRDLILFLGSFSLFLGIFGQVLGLYQATGVIQQAGEISPTLIWGGFRVSLIAPIMGFIVLLISSIFWFILKPKN